MKAPAHWQRTSALSLALMPLSWCVAMGGRARRAWANPARAPVPVICIGNLVAGGAGKTPVAIAVADALFRHGRTVHFLSRGYGGREVGPLRVDPDRHTANDVGDEPLLLARRAPTWIARDRASGAASAANEGAEIVVMDDGFQNPTIAKDLSFVVVDGGYGFGNGHVMPAGPLREPLADGFSRADAVILMEPDEAGIAAALPTTVPVLRAALRPTEPDALSGKSVYAFAGIGRPEKFFATLREMGAILAGTREFPDHHAYSDADTKELIDAARQAAAIPVTTEKDTVRLPPPVRTDVTAVPVEIGWDDEKALEALLSPYF